MSIEVDDFKYLQGKNDSEYIALLEETLRQQREITLKAITKISQLSSKNGWLTCNDTMPPDGEYILIFDGCKVLQAIYYKSINGYWNSRDLFIEAKDIAYWMPFPDPPIKEAQNES